MYLFSLLNIINLSIRTSRKNGEKDTQMPSLPDFPTCLSLRFRPIHRTAQSLCAVFRTSCEHFVIMILILFLCVMEQIILINRIIFFFLRLLERSYLQLQQLKTHQKQKWTAGQRVSFLIYQFYI